MAFKLPRIASSPPDRQALNWLLACCVLVVAGHASRLPLWLSLITGCALAWRYLAANHAWRLPGRILRTVLTVGLALAIFRQFGTLIGRDAGMAFLVGLLALKLLELRSERDYALTVFLGYFLMLGGFLYSEEVWVAVYMVAVALVATAALVRLSQPGRFDVRQSLRFAALLFAKALPLVLILYLFFPRIEGSLWGLPADAHGGLTGLSDQMRLGSLNQLSQNSAVVFRAEFDGAVPPRSKRYWRGLVLTDTDGRTWSVGRTFALAGASFEGLGPPTDYSVILEPQGKRWLFALDLPALVPDGAMMEPDYTLLAFKRVTERIDYQMRSYTDYRTKGLSDQERAAALRLPAPPDPRIAALVAGWRDGGTDDVSVAQKALRFFHDQDFVYTLSPPRLLGDDPVVEFLFDTRRGFCEHFAAAFVTLMRAAGIPSRVVTGYQGGELNPAGNYLVVTQADAHAWAEIWLKGRGWVRMDPTAAVAPERIEYGMQGVQRLLRRGSQLGQLQGRDVADALRAGWVERGWRALSNYADALNNAWNRWVLDFGPERQRRFLEALGFRTPSWLSMALVLISGVGLSLLVTAALMLRKRTEPDPVRALYDRFCARLARAGLARRPSEGPRDYAARCVAARPDLGPQVRAITELYVRLRYGGLQGRNPERLLRDRVRRFRPRRRPSAKSRADSSSRSD
jgi:transglutaminase-like putative cysteine protease